MTFCERLRWVLLFAAIAIPAAATSAAAQPIDEEYTRLIREHLQDERITTELVEIISGAEAL